MENAFGKKLRELRLKSGMGLRELASNIKKSPGYISDVELGNVPPPSETVIITIAGELGVEKAELLSAARKADPELTRYVISEPGAANFLRMAKEQGFEGEDWDRLSQLAAISKLGKEGKKDK